MGKNGIGSASIVLVFVVLCLTIFAVISLVPALTERNLAEAEVRLVQNFYAADAIAEQILAELLMLDEAPESLLGIDIYAYWSWELFLEIASFVVPVSETHLLYVSVGLDYDAYHIFAWQMIPADEWQADDGIDVWDGQFDFTSDTTLQPNYH